MNKRGSHYIRYFSCILFITSTLSALGNPSTGTKIFKQSQPGRRLQSLFKGTPVQIVEKTPPSQIQPKPSLYHRFETTLQDLKALKNQQVLKNNQPTRAPKLFPSMPHKTPLKIGEVVYSEQKVPQAKQVDPEAKNVQASPKKEEVPESPLPEPNEFGAGNDDIENDQNLEEDTEEIKKLKEQVLSLQMQLASRRRENANLLQNTEELNNKLNETTQKLEEEQEKQKNIVLIGGNRIVPNQQQTSIPQQTNNFKKEIETRIREIQAHASEREGNLVSQNAALQNEYNIAQKRWEAERNQFESDRNQWGQDKSDLISQVNTLQSNYDTLQGNYDTLQSNYDTVKNQLDIQKGKATLAKQRRKTNEIEIKRLKALIEALRRDLEEEQRQSKTLKNNNDILNNQLIAAQNATKSAREAADREKKAKEDAEEKARLALEEIERLKRLNKDLSSDLNNSISDHLSQTQPPISLKNEDFSYLRNNSFKFRDDSALSHKKGALTTTKSEEVNFPPNANEMDPNFMGTQCINLIKSLINPDNPTSVILDKNNLQALDENIKKLTQTNGPNAALSLADVVQQNEDLKQNNNHLINQLQQQQNAQNQIAQKNINLDKQLKKVQGENTNLTNQITQLQNNNNQLQADNQNLSTQSAQIQRNNVSLEIEVQRLTGTNDALNKQLKQVKDEHDKQRAIRERTSEENKKLKENSKNLIDNQKILTDQNKQLQKANDNLTQLNGTLIGNEAANKNLIQDLNKKIENLNNENKKLADQNKKGKVEQADLKKRIDQLIQEKNQLATNNQNLNDQLNQSQQNCTNLENKVHQLTKDNKDLTNQLINTQAILTSNNIAHTNLENELKDLRKFQGSVEKMLQDVNNSIQKPNNHTFMNSFKNMFSGISFFGPSPAEKRIQDLGQNIVHRIEQISQQTNQVQQENERIRSALNLHQNDDPQTAIQQLQQAQQDGNELKAQLAQMNQYLMAGGVSVPKSTDPQTNQLYTAIEQLKKDRDQLQLDKDQVVNKAKDVLSQSQKAPVGEITTATEAIQRIAQATEQISNTMGGNARLSIEERLHQLLVAQNQLENDKHQLINANQQIQLDKNQLLAENDKLKKDKTALSTSLDNEKQRANDFKNQLNQQNNKLKTLANGGNLASITDDEGTDIGKIKQHIEISSHQQSQLTAFENQVRAALKLRPNAKLPDNPLTALQRQYEAQGNQAYNKLIQEQEEFINQINYSLKTLNSKNKVQIKNFQDTIDFINESCMTEIKMAGIIRNLANVVNPEIKLMATLNEDLLNFSAEFAANIKDETLKAQYTDYFLPYNQTLNSKLFDRIKSGYNDVYFILWASMNGDIGSALMTRLKNSSQEKKICQSMEPSVKEKTENLNKFIIKIKEKLYSKLIEKIPDIVKLENKDRAQEMIKLLIEMYYDKNLINKRIEEIKNQLRDKAIRKVFKEILGIKKSDSNLDVDVNNFWSDVKSITW